MDRDWAVETSHPAEGCQTLIATFSTDGRGSRMHRGISGIQYARSQCVAGRSVWLIDLMLLECGGWGRAVGLRDVCVV